MNIFLLCPQLQGYQFTHAQNMIELSLMGGMPRQRRISVNTPHQVQASVWCNNEYEQQYFWAFWRTHLTNSLYFKWGIRVDSGPIEECDCKFSIEPPQESDRVAGKCRYSFMLWVKPLHRPVDFDQSIINLWNAGLNSLVLPNIEKIPNEWLPDAFGDGNIKRLHDVVEKIPNEWLPDSFGG